MRWRPMAPWRWKAAGCGIGRTGSTGASWRVTGRLEAVRVAVLGAGVVGVTSAWYLAQAGHEVTVLDRQPEAARETSFANGGQISVSHAEPWANPRAPAQVLKWLGRADAPLLFRLRADPAQWAWALHFLAECLPWRSRANTLAVLALAKHSQARLRELRAEAGIE